MRWLGGPVSLFFMVIGVSVVLGVGVAYGNVYAVAAIPAVLMMLVAVVWPRQVLLAIVAYIPLEPFILKWLPGGVSGVLGLVPEILLFVAAASAFLRPADSDGQTGRQLWLLWIAGFFAVGMVSAWVAGIPWLDAVYWIRTNLRYMSAAVIVGALGDRDWWIRSVAPVIAGGVIVQTGIAISQFVGGAPVRQFFAPASVVVGGRAFVDYAETGSTGISGTLGFYNNFGLYSVIATAVCVGALVGISESEALGALVGRTRTRLLSVGAWAGALNVLLSASRQSLLVLFAAGVAALLVVGPKRAGRRITPVIAAAAVFVAAVFLVPQLSGPLAWIPERFGQVVGGRAVAQSLQTDRLFAVVRVVPRVLVLSPLLGLGPGSLASLAGLGTAAGLLSLGSEGVSYVQDVGWVGIFVQSGLIGMALYLTLYIRLALVARGRYRGGMLDRGAGALMAAAFTIWGTGMIASSPQLVRSTSLILWTVMGLCVGGYRLVRSEGDEVSR